MSGVAMHYGIRYIGSVILRDRDANTAWEAAADGVLEEWVYYCQNWRGILVRYAKKSSNYLASIQLACILIWFRRLHRLRVLR